MSLILKLQLRIFIYLKNNCHLLWNTVRLCAVFSLSPINVLPYFHDLNDKKKIFFNFMRVFFFTCNPYKYGPTLTPRTPEWLMEIIPLGDVTSSFAHWYYLCTIRVYWSVSGGKESACSAEYLGLIPGLERFPGGGHGHQFQYSRLENPMDRGGWWATVHGMAKNRTQLSDEHKIF